VIKFSHSQLLSFVCRLLALFGKMRYIFGTREREKERGEGERDGRIFTLFSNECTK